MTIYIEIPIIRTTNSKVCYIYKNEENRCVIFSYNGYHCNSLSVTGD